LLFFVFLAVGVLADDNDSNWDDSNLDDEFEDDYDEADYDDYDEAEDDESFEDDYDEAEDDYDEAEDDYDESFDEELDEVEDDDSVVTFNDGERSYAFTSSFWLAVFFISILILIVAIFLFFFFRAPKNKWEKTAITNKNISNNFHKEGFFDKFKIKIKK